MVLVEVNLVAPRGRLGRHFALVDVEVHEHVIGASHPAAYATRPVPLERDALGKLFRRGEEGGGGYAAGKRGVRGEGKERAGANSVRVTGRRVLAPGVI